MTSNDLSAQLRSRVRAIAFHCGHVVNLIDNHELTRDEELEMQSCINRLGEALTMIVKTSEKIERRVE